MAPPVEVMSEDEIEDGVDHESGDENEDEDPWGPGGGSLPGIEDMLFQPRDRTGNRSSDELETLCQELEGAAVADAEKEVRTFLERTQGEVREADVLAILLMLFRTCRDSALEQYDTWDITLGYCGRITTICDANFVGNVSEDNRQTGCLSAAIVGTVYGEVGRTFALAGHAGVARDRLMKALHAFDLMGDSDANDESAKHQQAAARASLARVLRGVGRAGEALPEFMQALQLYITLDAPEDLSGIMSEWCETVVAAGSEHLTENVPALLCDLAEGAFGEGSPMHLKALNDVTNACTSLGEAWIATHAATELARHLREGGKIAGKKPVPFALREAEFEAAEEAAAAAWEQAVQKRLEEGDVAAAADAWAEALWLRESLGSSSPELLEAMRTSLEALRLAAEASTSAGGDDGEGDDDHHDHDHDHDHHDEQEDGEEDNDKDEKDKDRGRARSSKKSNKIEDDEAEEQPDREAKKKLQQQQKQQEQEEQTQQQQKEEVVADSWEDLGEDQDEEEEEGDGDHSRGDAAERGRGDVEGSSSGVQDAW